MKQLQSLAALGLVLFSLSAHAQGSGASAPVSAAKKELMAKVIRLQQPGIEGIARLLVEQPAVQMMQQAGAVLQRLPADRREAIARDIQADVRNYVEAALPGVRAKALEIAPAALGPILESNFSESELKQIVAILESPVNRKFQSLAGSMQRALSQKLVAEEKAEVTPKLNELRRTVGQRLQAAGAASAASR